MRLVRFCVAVALIICAAATAEARKPKPTTAPVMLPTIWQTWEFPGYGEVRVDMLAENGHVTGKITNSTTLKIALAGITFRTYRQPLSGVVAGTSHVQPTDISFGQVTLLTPLSDLDLEKGCALVFDSISIDFEFQNGARKTLKLNADANPPPLWYAPGPACAAQKQAYEAARLLAQLTAPLTGPIEKASGNGVSQPSVILKIDPVYTEKARAAAPEPQPSEISVFVLVIDTPDDVVTSVAATEEAAVRELYKYVRRKWNRPIPPPADDDDAVDLFFDSADSDYEIREQPLIR